MAMIACGSAKLDLIHAMSQPLGRYHMAHGLANGILIPYVMEYNLAACKDKFAQMAIAIGEGSHRMSMSELAERAIERIKSLFIEAGFPTKLPADVVDKKDIPTLAKIASGKTKREIEQTQNE